MKFQQRTKIFSTKTLLLIACCLGLSSCSLNFWPFSHDKSEPVRADGAESKDDTSSANGSSGQIQPPQSKASKSSDVELKQARIWNRLDDLEGEVSAQRQRIKLLEQGLLTGIAPEEMKKAPKGKGKAKPVAHNSKMDAVEEPTKEELPAPVLDLPEKLTPSAADGSAANTPDSYKVRAQVAKDYIQSSRYGLAVAELAQIMREFGPKAGEGEAKYLLGRSYLGLREFVTSRTELEGFLKEFPKSPFEGMARLDLAKAYMGLNLRERARKEYASVAKEFEGRDEGDMAANELKGMKGTL